MKLLLHTCCAPCAIYPIRVLREKGDQVMGYFHRSNIHPYSECLRRQEALEAYSREIDLRLIIERAYDLEGFLRNAAFREAQRCRLCYHSRLYSTALIAKRGKFDAFSSTLLYSKFQKHEMISDMGQVVAASVGIPFYYEDFRKGWKEGIEVSKRLGIYRQAYCGCIYSEKERYNRHQP
jgi:predicted adenine nucleotide alpha hydrolase (AANH) superfamily ATPase